MTRFSENRIGHTKVSFAAFLEHPSLIFQLKDVSENWKTLWARRNSAPWAYYISCCQNDDEAQNEAKVWRQQLGECSKRETPLSISIGTSESTYARTTSRRNCHDIETHRYCSDLEGDPRCTDFILRAFQLPFMLGFDVETSQKFGIARSCEVDFGSRLVHET